MPREDGKGVRESRDAASGFTFVGVRIERSDAAGVKQYSRADVDGDQAQSHQRAISPARRFVFHANLGSDQSEQLGDEDPREEYCQNPEVDGRKRVRGITFAEKRTEQSDAFRL